MKKAFLVLLALAVVAVFTSCSSNANLVPQCSKAVISADAVIGEIVYTGYSFSIQRINVKGVNYLVNSEGGIVKE